MNLLNELVEEADICVKLLVRHSSPVDRDLAFHYSRVLDSLTKRIHIAVSTLKSTARLEHASSHFADLVKQLEGLPLADEVSSLIEKIHSRQAAVEKMVAFYDSSLQHPAA